jgi:hypothetical protein
MEELSMSNFPKLGMKYEQAIKTAIRHGKEGSGDIVHSMANQVRLAEGTKAQKEFYKEVSAKAQGK